MKYKTSELTGAFLNAAVATALGLRFELNHYRGDGSHPIDKCELIIELAFGGTRHETFEASTDWTHGGTIIDNNQIDIYHYGREVMPSLWEVAAETHAGCRQYGPTALVAAMRSFIVWKIGEEVDL